MELFQLEFIIENFLTDTDSEKKKFVQQNFSHAVTFYNQITIETS